MAERFDLMRGAQAARLGRRACFAAVVLLCLFLSYLALVSIFKSSSGNVSDNSSQAGVVLQEGYAAFPKCTEEQRVKQGAAFGRSRKQWGWWFFGCKLPENLDTYLALLFDPYTRPVTLINIGANKGYNLVAWLSVWLPSLRKNPEQWGQQMKKLYGNNITGVCGACGDCKSGQLELERYTLDVKPETPKGPQIYGLEPNPLNMEVLDSLKEWAAYDSLFVHQVAASNVSGTAKFPNTKRGDTMGSLDKTDGSTVDVKLTTVDEFLEEQQIDHIDFLLTDVEGYDPLVLQGAAKTLQNQKVSFLEFEYNSMGPWKDHTLKKVVEDLDAYGYECYFPAPKAFGGSTGLVRLTGCWDDVYEIHDWSNVLCAVRTNMKLITFLESHCVWLL